MTTYSTTARLLWVISKAKLQEVQPNDYLTTQELKCGIPNLEYCLEFFPNGQDTTPDRVWIYLTLHYSKKDASSKVEYTVKVKSASLCKDTDIVTLTDGEGSGISLSKRENFFDESKKFFEDGKLTIELEAKITYEEPLYRCITKKENIAHFLWESDDKDFTLDVEDKELKVHKLILKANSEVFKAMLASGMKEAQENRCPIVDFSHECVKLVIKLLYRQRCVCKVDEEFGSKLLRFADKYDIEYLQNLIEDVLIPKISTDNVIKLANMAVTSNASQLQEYCICYLHSAIENHTSIKNIEGLNEKIAAEVASRLLSPFIETL